MLAPESTADDETGVTTVCYAKSNFKMRQLKMYLE